MSSSDSCKVQAIDPIWGATSYSSNDASAAAAASASHSASGNGECAPGDTTCLQIQAAATDFQILGDLAQGDTKGVKQGLNALASLGQ